MILRLEPSVIYKLFCLNEHAVFIWLGYECLDATSKILGMICEISSYRAVWTG
jgi:hypothetical protein